MTWHGEMATGSAMEGVPEAEPGHPGWTARQRRGIAALLAAMTLLAAVGLRFWRLSWGLANGEFFPDELIFSGRAAAFVPLSWASFDLHDFLYPTLYGYLAGAATAIAHALGVLPAPGRYPPGAILMARIVSAAAGVLTVGVVGVLANRMYSRRVGLAATALMAVAPLHALHVHIAATDVTLTAFAALTLLAAHALAGEPRPTLAAAAGMAAGLGLATKYNGLALLVPVGWAILEGAIRARSPRPCLALGLVSLAAFGATFLAACPPCLLHLDQVRAALRLQYVLTRAMPWGFGNNYLTPTLGWYGRPYCYELVASFPFTLGWPLYALALAGIGVALWRHERADRLLLASLVSYFLVVARYPLVFPRYLLPLFPGLVVLAARAVADFSRWRRARVAMLAAVWAYSLVFTATQVARFSFDQRRELARWIKEARPAARERPVAVPHVMRTLDYFRLAGPLARAGLRSVQVDDGHWLDGQPEVFVLPEWKAIEIHRDRPASPAARELERLEAGTAGYRAAARWSSWFLQRDFYTHLDPAFAGDLWQGEVGYTVYLREPSGGGG